MTQTAAQDSCGFRISDKTKRCYERAVMVFLCLLKSSWLITLICTNRVTAFHWQVGKLAAFIDACPPLAKGASSKKGPRHVPVWGPKQWLPRLFTWGARPISPCLLRLCILPVSHGACVASCSSCAPFPQPGYCGDCSHQFENLKKLATIIFST